MSQNLSKELSFLEMAAHCFPNVEGNSLQDAIVLASTHVALRHKRLRLLKLLLSDKQRAAIMEIFEQLLPPGETTVTLTVRRLRLRTCNQIFQPPGVCVLISPPSFFPCLPFL